MLFINNTNIFALFPLNQRPQVLLRSKIVSADVFLVSGHKNLSNSVGIFLRPSGLFYGSFVPTLRVSAGSFAAYFRVRRCTY